jgi:hypothetical protein
MRFDRLKERGGENTSVSDVFEPRFVTKNKVVLMRQC